MTAAGFDVLATIVAATRKRVESARVRVSPKDLESLAGQRGPDAQRFREAVSGAPAGYRVIAECKRRSPSRGVLRHDYDAAAIAAAYEASGAAAISVLTEPAFFDGSLAHLEAVRATVSVPVLRKDFIIDEYQVLESRASGADAVLLIVAALTDECLRRLMALAADAGLAALVEVHDATELDRALQAGAAIIGVNNRSLKTLDVSVATSAALVGAIPDACVAVAESGLRSGADLRRLRDEGFDAFLIGERLVAAGEPGVALAALLREAEGAGAGGVRA